MDDEAKRTLKEEFGATSEDVEMIERQEQVLDALYESEDPVLTSHEIGEQIGLPSREAFEVLREMQLNGMVQRKQTVWWPTVLPQLEREACALFCDPTNNAPLSISQIRRIICDEE